MSWSHEGVYEWLRAPLNDPNRSNSGKKSSVDVFDSKTPLIVKKLTEEMCVIDPTW